MLFRILVATALTLASVAGYAHASFHHLRLPAVVSVDAWMKSDEAPTCRASSESESAAICQQESPGHKRTSHKRTSHR
ncbi:hypothetical protein [Afifella aestuarii]|uniref:hypothetical protein n=1 Tax=Afifella aestuarii TaxID=1909496 RepID=UPI000FE3CA9E|nr:hypothetical protein [Afifella aestuarii]